MSPGPEGLWDASTDVESSAIAALHAALSGYADVIRDVYEAGVQVPTVPARNHNAKNLRAAALFLRRTLGDLRATWLLVERGYSSAGATTAASLWEHALGCCILAADAAREAELAGAKDGDLPWRPRVLAELGTRAIEGTDISGEVLVQRQRNVYASYRWLCKVKHPTLRATIHEAGSTLDAAGAFVVMAAPDVRDEDLPVKEAVLTIAVARTLGAIRTFQRALECDPATVEAGALEARLSRAETAITGLARRHVHAQLPFTLTASEGKSL